MNIYSVTFHFLVHSQSANMYISYVSEIITSNPLSFVEFWTTKETNKTRTQLCTTHFRERDRVRAKSMRKIRGEMLSNAPFALYKWGFSYRYIKDMYTSSVGSVLGFFFVCWYYRIYQLGGKGASVFFFVGLLVKYVCVLDWLSRSVDLCVGIVCVFYLFLLFTADLYVCRKN